MKIIHCADVHLGSAFERLPAEKRAERKRELRATFSSMTEYARREGVRAVMICGDLFDGDRPPMSDKEFFFSAVRSCPNTDFLYLRGNHDLSSSYEEELPNLKTFGGEWKYYEYENVRIGGAEAATDFSPLPDSFRAEPGMINIAMLHGQLKDSADPGCIDRRAFCGRGIDYLALGHEHAFREAELPPSGVAVYPGCLEGRGYDEPGEHGFVLLDAADGKLTFSFVPFAKRKIRYCQVDVAGAAGAEEIIRRATDKAGVYPDDLMRIELTGETLLDCPDIADEIRTRLSSSFYDLSVKDESKRKTDYSVYADDISIRGEFYRRVMSDPQIRDADREEVVRTGMRFLDGKDL